MSSTLTNLRGRRVRYDNIAVGAAAGTERTIRGDTVSVAELPGGGFATSTSTGDVWHTNVAVGNVVSDQVSPNTVPENIGVRAEAPMAGENVKVGG